MPSNFTHYWQPERSNGRGLTEQAFSRQFRERGVKTGDRVYFVFIRGGSLYLVGALTVSSSPAQLGDGEERIDAKPGSATEKLFDRVVSPHVARKLTRVGPAGGLNFLPNGRLDGQTLRGVQQITADSGKLLEEILVSFVSLGNAPSALFINGVFRSVLSEILDAQRDHGVNAAFLQPHKGQVITMLRDRMPTVDHPVRLYASVSDDPSRIAYAATIVGWEDKRDMSQRRRSTVRRHLAKFQPREVDLFDGVGEIGDKSVNLIAVEGLRELGDLYATSLLSKVSDGAPLKKRTRSGGWSEVYDIGEISEVPAQPMRRCLEELESAVEEASSLSDESLQKRLQAAPKFPARMQVLSFDYKRNPDVIVAVLRRAKGKCERCSKPGPFPRRSDGSLYLEVHHKVQLAHGGEDTTANAIALCPNCHREAHHGANGSYW